MSGLGPLNLSDADLKGFDAVEPGRYIAEVFKMSNDAVKNADGQGKLPAGTPQIKVQFKLLSTIDGTTEGIENRRVFNTYNIPPDSYEKAKMMKGMLVRFFTAVGFPEEEVMSKKFDPSYEDIEGTKVVVIVGKEPKKDRSGAVIPDEYNNPVKGVKHIDTAGEVAAGSSLL